MNVRPLALVWLLLLSGLCLGAGPARSAGTGADLIHNETDRLAHPDVPGSVDSTVVRDRVFGFWHQEWGPELRLNVDLEHETYGLEAADGTALIDLALLRLHPRLRIARDDWSLNSALLALNVSRTATLFTPVAEDTKDSFVLPALVWDWMPGPVRVRAGFWEEYEILTLDNNEYTVSIARVLLLGAGYAFSEKVEGRVEAQVTSRYYPAPYSLDRSDMNVSFRWQDPRDEGEEALWREASVKLALQHYAVSGDKFLELTLGSVLRTATGAVTHFFVPELVLADSAVTYAPGALPTSLLEQVIDEADVTVRLKYEGFRHIGGGPVVIAWGAALESSLIQQVQRGFVVHLKAEYTY